MHAHHVRLTLALAIALVVTAAFSAAALVSAGGGECRTQAITEGAGVAVEVSGFCYEPTVLRIGAGQTVEWTNRDAAPHTVSGVNGVWGDFTQFGLDESISFSFSTPGVFPYFCAIHPTMIGTVVVGDADMTVAAASMSGSSTNLVWLVPVVLATLAAGAFLGVVRRR